MKISWGTGIVIVFAIFFIVVLGTVAFTTTLNVNLVADNYYEQELKHQNQIDKVQRTKELPEQIKIDVSQGFIAINFPSLFQLGEISGKLHFYRPADNKKDFDCEIELKDGLQQIIPTENIDKGLWKIKIDWIGKNVEYFNEQIVMIN